MPFKLNAFLPSSKQTVQIKELTYRHYRELVKSLYSVDKEETIQQYNSILTDLCPDIANKNITFEDKLSLLLTIRNYCVSPDLKLKGTTADDNVFNFSVPVDTLIQSLKTIDKSSVIKFNGFEVKITSYKARDEWVFIGNNKEETNILASYIEYIAVQDKTVEFNNLSWDERVNIVLNLPSDITNILLQTIQEIEDYYEQQDFLVVKNPISKSKEIVLRISKNFTQKTMQQIIGLIFTENLTNIYRALYNMVVHAGFDANYIDNITPVEMQVYWMYYTEEKQKQTTTTPNTNQLSLPSVENKELGF